jgi:hypothetical protein
MDEETAINTFMRALGGTTPGAIADYLEAM